MRALFLAALLAFPLSAIALRYPGETTSAGMPSPSIVTGRWVGLSFRGRLRVPHVTRGRLLLQAETVVSGTAAGTPTGDVRGTATLRGVACTVSGLLTDAAAVPAVDPQAATWLRLCIACGAAEEDAGCTYYVDGARP